LGVNAVYIGGDSRRGDVLAQIKRDNQVRICYITPEMYDAGPDFVEEVRSSGIFSFYFRIN
jgi:hypothetical protein